MSMAKYAAATLGAACLILTTAAPSSAAVTTRVRVPVDSRLFIPCANGGAGEVIHLTGTILGVSTTNGSVEVEQGVSGVGETTGLRYREQFVNLFRFNETGALTSTQQEIYAVSTSGQRLTTIRIRNHTTITPDGRIVVATDDVTQECLATSP